MVMHIYGRWDGGSNPPYVSKYYKMGVTTTADEKRREAHDLLKKSTTCIKTAIEKLEVMVDSDTWGGNDWTKEFIAEAENDIDELILLNRKIKKILVKY